MMIIKSLELDFPFHIAKIVAIDLLLMKSSKVCLPEINGVRAS